MNSCFCYEPERHVFLSNSVGTHRSFACHLPLGGTSVTHARHAHTHQVQSAEVSCSTLVGIRCRYHTCVTKLDHSHPSRLSLIVMFGTVAENMKIRSRHGKVRKHAERYSRMAFSDLNVAGFIVVLYLIKTTIKP